MMPLNVPALVRIDHDLRFAPSAAARRQTLAAERLAGMIEPGTVYPEDFVVYQVTGFRPDLRSPEMIPGEALLADMPALLDRLSRRAAFTRADLPASRWLTVLQAMSRLGVSRKTIERLRHRGLLARRITLGGGRSMNVFDVDVLDNLCRTRADGRPTRVGRRAGPAKRAGGVRSGLKSSSRQRASGAMLARRRRLVERAMTRGISPASIAGRLRCSAATVHRLQQQAIADRCRAVRLVVPSGAESLMRDQAERFIADPALAAGLLPPAPTTLAEWVAEAVLAAGPDPLGERARAFGYWALVWRAQGITRSIDRTRPQSSAVDRVVTDLRWAAMVKSALVWAEAPLLLRTIAVQTGTELIDHPSVDARALLRESIAALSAAVDRFDPSTGRLAGVSGLELSRAVSAWQRSARQGAAKARASAVPDRPLPDWRQSLCAWQAWTQIPAPVVAGLGFLPQAAGTLLRDRYGMGGSPPFTLAELARQRRVSAAATARNVRSAMVDASVLGKGGRAKRRRSAL